MAGRRTPLTVPEIEAIAKVWAETLSINGTANRLGFDFETVKKYIDEGDPGRGIKPIRQRQAAIQPGATVTKDPATKVAVTAEQAKSESLHILRGYKGLFSKKLAALHRRLDAASRIADPDEREAAEAKVLAELPMRELVRLLEAEQLLLGQPTSRPEHTGNPDLATAVRSQRTEQLMNVLRDAGLIRPGGTGTEPKDN